MLLVIIVIIGAILRFYGLMWGDGFFFHPDENNMARAIAQMRFEDGLNPNFFAYGQFPLYSAWILSYITNIVSGIETLTVPVRTTVLWLRILSASFSVGTIILTYFLTKNIFQEFAKHRKVSVKCGSYVVNFGYWPALLASLLVACTPGLIQAAHFGTTESMMTFWYMLLTYLSVKLIHKTTKVRMFWLGIVFGVALATKVSAGYFVIMMAATRIIITAAHWKRKDRKKAFGHGLRLTFITGIASVLAFIMLSPYNFLDSQGFIGSMNYETDVAAGNVVVFYTKQFVDSVPVLFQLVKVFPYNLGWPLFLTGASGIVLGLYQSIRKPKESYALILVLIALFGYMIPNMFLFAKWTRFMTPILPFIGVFGAFALYKIRQAVIVRFIRIVTVIFIVVACIIPGFALFLVYTKPDVRVQASEWINDNINPGSYILSETANVVDIPVQLRNEYDEPIHNNYTVISFDFYHVDQDHHEEELINHIERADYIFVPSRRIFANHLGKREYPIVNTYYEALFNNDLGFELVSVCNPDCKNLDQAEQAKGFTGTALAESMLIGDEAAEETFTVFDHPVVRIYKKNNQLTQEEYKTLLGL